MPASPRLTYEELLVEVGELDAAQQLLLLEELASAVRRSMEGRRRSILELRGMGKESWRDVDVQEYVARERAAWSG